jgi:hypothetical protein
LLPEDADRDVTVSMNGYLSGTWSGNDVTEVIGVNISASAGLVARTA